MIGRPIAFALALFSALLFTVPQIAFADRVGKPYRGPSELLTGGGQGAGDDSGGEGGGEGGGETGDGGGGGANTGPRGNQAAFDGTRVWQWWFEHQKDRLIARSNVRGRVRFNSSYYWFGGGAKYKPRQLDPVSEKVLSAKIFPTLQKLVKDPSAAVRAEACIAMGRIKNVPAPMDDRKEGVSDNLVVREMIAVLKRTPAAATNADIRNSAILAIGMTGDPTGADFLLRHIKTAQDNEAGFTAIALGLARHKPAIPILASLLPKKASSRATDQNVGAIHGLGLFGTGFEAEFDEAKIPAKLGSLARPSGTPLIVMQAVVALGRIQKNFKAVSRAFSAKALPIKWTAVLSMGYFADDAKDAKAAVKMLTGKVFKSGEGQIKNFSLLACGDLAYRLDPNSKERASLIKHIRERGLDAKDNYLRQCGAIAAGVSGDKGSIPMLAALLDNTAADHRVMAAACVALGLLRATDHADKIMKKVMLQTKWNADARGYAALGIALMGDTSNMKALKSFAASKLNDKTMRQVPLALGVLGSKQDLNSVIRRFGKKWQKSAAREVAQAAYSLGFARDTGAVNAVQRLAGNGLAEVRGMAAIALGYLGMQDDVSPLSRCLENVSHRNSYLWKSVLAQISRIL